MLHFFPPLKIKLQLHNIPKQIHRVAHNDYLLVVSQYQRSRCALVNQIPNLLLHSGVSLRGDSFKGLDNNTPWGC